MAVNDRMRDERFFTWVVFRVIFSIIIAVIVLSFVFNFIMRPNTTVYTDWIWQLFGILIFIWVISWIFRPWHYGYFGQMHEMRILRRRFARGEITEAEFKRKMKVLRESHKNES
jgi:hypothetical protein